MSCSFFTVWMSPSPLFSFFNLNTPSSAASQSFISALHLHVVLCISPTPSPLLPSPSMSSPVCGDWDTGGSSPCHLQPYQCHPSMASHKNWNQSMLISLVFLFYFFDQLISLRIPTDLRNIAVLNGIEYGRVPRLELVCSQKQTQWQFFHTMCGMLQPKCVFKRIVYSFTVY